MDGEDDMDAIDGDDAKDGVSIPDMAASVLVRFVPQVATAAMASAVSVATNTTKSQTATLMWSGGTTGVACKLVSANVTWRDASAVVVDIFAVVVSAPKKSLPSSRCTQNFEKKHI